MGARSKAILRPVEVNQKPITTVTTAVSDRAYRVNDMPCGEPTRARRFRLARLATPKLDAFREDGWTSRAMDRSIHTTPTPKCRIGRIHDRIHLLERYVSASQLDPYQICHSRRLIQPGNDRQSLRSPTKYRGLRPLAPKSCWATGFDNATLLPRGTRDRAATERASAHLLSCLATRDSCDGALASVTRLWKAPGGTFSPGAFLLSI
jgi:hypothetical protein